MSVLYTNTTKFHESDYEFDLLIRDILEMDEYFKEKRRLSWKKLDGKPVSLKQFPKVVFEGGFAR